MPRHLVFKPDCKKCRRLVRYMAATSSQFPDYFCKPVPAFGDPEARMLIVGLAPGKHGANKTGRPFTGDASGDMLFETLYRTGFASLPNSKSIDDGLQLFDCRITNAVKCLPPDNKPTTTEIANCRRYLEAELIKLSCHAVIVALGKIAHDAVVAALLDSIISEQKLSRASLPFGHHAIYQLDTKYGKRVLISSYHCSRYNTQTKRLTGPMLDQVFESARYNLNNDETDN